MNSTIAQALRDVFYFPTWGRGVLCIWRRNFLYFRYTLFTTLAWIFVEPLLNLFALGYGLGHFVTNINGLTYAEFIAPAMMAVSGMFVAFFEGTYPTYTKMHRQNTYQTIILTPVSPDEVAMGEIFWITSKAFLSVVSVAIVFAFMGLVQPERLPLALAVLLLMCWVFAAFGIWLSTIAKSYESFSYSQSGIIMPMSLFCGTYFPLEQLPAAVKYMTYLFPLTHGLMSVRILFSNEFHSIFFINILYLLVTAILLSNLAVARFARQLIK